MYRVSVYTEDVPYADTEGEVYITIHGDRGDTGKRKLLKAVDDDAANEEKFQPGQVMTKSW